MPFTSRATETFCAKCHIGLSFCSETLRYAAALVSGVLFVDFSVPFDPCREKKGITFDMQLCILREQSGTHAGGRDESPAEDSRHSQCHERSRTDSVTFITACRDVICHGRLVHHSHTRKYCGSTPMAAAYAVAVSENSRAGGGEAHAPLSPRLPPTIRSCTPPSPSSLCPPPSRRPLT